MDSINHNLEHNETELKLDLLDAACQNLPLVMFSVDPDGTIIFAKGKEDLRIADLHPNELKGKKVKDIFKEARGIQTVHDSALKGYHGSYEWFNDESAIQVYVRPRLNDNGQTVGMICVGIDVSENRRFEKRLIESKHQAERALRTKSDFLNVMSHEIRTPLNAIIGISHLLSEEETSDTIHENIQILKYSAENLLSLINDVLDFGKLESGKVDLDLRPILLKQLVSASINALEVKSKEKNLRLNVIYNDSIPDSIIADPTRLNQILNNLIGNAIKFTEKGHVTLRLMHRFLPANKVAIRFMVEDSGIGIPENRLDSIFEEFVQADSGVSKKFGGSGLGLSISKFLVELMGGTLSVNSKLGDGSVFHFELVFDVVIPSSHSDLAENKVDTSTALKEVRVLLVDDNNVNRKIAARFLKKWNMEVFEAADGLEAFEMTKKENFDVILMDLQMPIMDGYESAKSIAEWEKKHGRYTPILAVTAETMDDVKKSVRDAGMIDTVTKPFKPELLFRAINDAVRIKD